MFVVVSEDKDASHKSDRFTGTKDLYQTRLSHHLMTRAQQGCALKADYIFKCCFVCSLAPEILG